MAQAARDYATIGLCLVVRDLDRSTRFYCDGLGFIQGDTAERGSEVASNLELPSCKLLMRYLGRSDTRLELVKLLEPETLGGEGRRPANTAGPFMLGFRVDDVPAAAQRLVELGGIFILEGKAGAQKNHQMMMVADPDGFRIELTSMPMDRIKPLFGQ